MLDSLIHRQDRDVARSGKPAAVQHRLKARQHAHGPVGGGVDSLDKVRTRQMEALSWNGPAVMRQQAGLVSEDRFDSGERRTARVNAGY